MSEIVSINADIIPSCSEESHFPSGCPWVWHAVLQTALLIIQDKINPTYYSEFEGFSPSCKRINVLNDSLCMSEQLLEHLGNSWSNGTLKLCIFKQI